MPTNPQAKAKVVKAKSSANQTVEPVVVVTPPTTPVPPTKQTKAAKAPKPTPPTPTPRNNITKKDIVTRVADKTGLSMMVADIAVNAAFDAMKSALLKGDRIELRNFGVFELKPRKAGLGRNPKTGKEVPLVAGRGKTVKFKMGKELKE